MIPAQRSSGLLLDVTSISAPYGISIVREVWWCQEVGNRRLPSRMSFSVEVSAPK